MLCRDSFVSVLEGRSKATDQHSRSRTPVPQQSALPSSFSPFCGRNFDSETPQSGAGGLRSQSVRPEDGMTGQHYNPLPVQVPHKEREERDVMDSAYTSERGDGAGRGR
ncbi:hypothetical protein VZT92_014723 [Zoarces viviparus]|uniref:Uncharacterized protein n=1 Tax=Zoarces viviparus TaxID=48416 RepID=A0AAW1F242_ZOAVI